MTKQEYFSNTIDRELLESHVYKIEKTIFIRDETNAVIKDLLEKAKKDKLNPKIIKQVIRLRKKAKEEREAEQHIIDTYMSALEK